MVMPQSESARSRFGRSLLAIYILAAAFAAILVLGAQSSTPVMANGQPAFVVEPEFFHMVSSPGKTVSMNVTVADQTSTYVAVAFNWAKLPTGWAPQLRGGVGSFEIEGANVGPSKPVTLSLDIPIPKGTQPGDYHFTLDATAVGSGAEQSVPLTISVTSATGGSAATSTPGTVSLQPPAFVDLEGPNSNTFQFQVTLNNNTGSPVTANLSAHMTSAAAQGWTISFKPAFKSTEITSASIVAGGSQQIDINVKPPQSASPGVYGVAFAAHVGAHSLASQFHIQITGTHKLSVATPNGLLDAKVSAGKPGSVAVVVQNTGTGNLQNVSLVGSAPPNWNVTFSPSKISTLGAGQAEQVTANIQPPGDAIPGDYGVTVTASTPGTSDNVNLNVQVSQTSIWGWVGLGIAVVVIGGLFGLFFKLGRR